MVATDTLAELAIGRSAIRRRILELLLENTGEPYHLREIQRRAATTPGTASRELAHLVRAGLVERRPAAGHVTFVVATTPLVETLRGIVPAPAAHVPEPRPVAVELARRFAATLRTIYGARLRRVLLVGSTAADDDPPPAEAGPLRIVAVLSWIDRYGEELDRTSVGVANLSLESGRVFSRLFVTEADWSGRSDALFNALRAESIEL